MKNILYIFILLFIISFVILFFKSKSTFITSDIFSAKKTYWRKNGNITNKFDNVNKKYYFSLNNNNQIFKHIEFPFYTGIYYSAVLNARVDSSGNEHTYLKFYLDNTLLTSFNITNNEWSVLNNYFMIKGNLIMRGDFKILVEADSSDTYVDIHYFNINFPPFYKILFYK